MSDKRCSRIWDYFTTTTAGSPIAEVIYELEKKNEITSTSGTSLSTSNLCNQPTMSQVMDATRKWTSNSARMRQGHKVVAEMIARFPTSIHC